jgi:hypothetical protein
MCAMMEKLRMKQAPAGHQDQLAERLSAAIQLTVDRAGPT